MAHEAAALFEGAREHVRHAMRHGDGLSPVLQRRLFALFTQATEGAAPERDPAFYETEERERLREWRSLANLSADEAMREYAALADALPTTPEPLIARQAAALHDAAAVALLGAQRQRTLLTCARASLQPLLPTLPAEDEADEGRDTGDLAQLSARLKHLEGEIARCGVEDKMRQTHSRRQLAEEMVAQQLETLEGRLSTLRRTQKALAHVSRLGWLAHPSFPRFVLLLTPAFGLFWLLFSLPRLRVRVWDALCSLVASVR